MASSRNMSGEGDFFFGAGGDVRTAFIVPRSATLISPALQSSLTSLSSVDAKYRYAHHATSSPRTHHKTLPPGSPRSSHKPMSSRMGSTASSTGPLTPPPSPPFNARQAAAQCRAMDGYVSFANIEGLGIPEGSDEDTDEDAKSRSRWFQWLQLKSNNDHARHRSENSSVSR